MKEIFDFISSIVSSISWPLFAVIAVLAFRKPLAGLLNRTRKVEAAIGGVTASAQFETLKEQRETAAAGRAAAQPDNSEANKPKPAEQVSLQQQIELIADISPAAAIPFAYSQIENKCVRSLPDIYSWKTERNYLNTVMLDLHKGNHINTSEYTLFKTIKTIHDTVLFNKDAQQAVSRQSAIEYGKSAEMIIDLLSSLQEEP